MPGVEIKVKPAYPWDGGALSFKLRDTTPMKHVMTMYATHKGVDFGTLSFIYAGERVRADQTAKMLGMGDGDTIEVVQAQVGRTTSACKFNKYNGHLAYLRVTTSSRIALDMQNRRIKLPYFSWAVRFHHFHTYIHTRQHRPIRPSHEFVEISTNCAYRSSQPTKAAAARSQLAQQPN